MQSEENLNLFLNSGEAIFTGGGNPKPLISSGEGPADRSTRAASGIWQNSFSRLVPRRFIGKIESNG